MHVFKIFPKMCFKEYLNLTLLFFKHVLRLTGYTLLIFNTSMSTSALTLTIEYLIVAKKNIYFLTPSFKGKNFEAGVSKGGHSMHSMHRFRLP